MAITVNTAPATLVPALNPVGVELATDEYVQQAGSKATVQVDVTADPVDGDTFQVAWGSESVTFTFRNVPSSSTDIPTPNGAYRDDWTQGELMRVLQEYYALSEAFTLVYLSGSQTEGHFQINAREKGSAYTPTLTISATGIAQSNAVPGVDRLLRSDLKVLLDVYLEEVYSSDSFRKVAPLEGRPDESSKVRFDISRVLQGFLEPDIPAFGATTIAQASKFLKRYILRYTEHYDSAPHAYKRYPINQTDSLQALQGRLRFADFPGNTFNADLSGNPNKFLTNMPRKVRVTTTQQNFLFYFVPVANALQLKAKIYYTDSTSRTETILTAAIGTYDEKVAILPTGYTQLGIGGFDASKIVKKYEVWVAFDSSPQLSEVVTYELDHRYYANNRYLLFQNRKGGFDSVWLSGLGEMASELEAEDVDKVLPFDYPKTEHGHLFYNRMERDGWKVNTGHKTRAEVRWLKELMNSSYIYLVEAARFLPVEIPPDSVAYPPDDANRQQLSFTFQEANWS